MTLKFNAVFALPTCAGPEVVFVRNRSRVVFQRDVGVSTENVMQCDVGVGPDKVFQYDVGVGHLSIDDVWVDPKEFKKMKDKYEKLTKTVSELQRKLAEQRSELRYYKSGKHKHETVKAHFEGHFSETQIRKLLYPGRKHQRGYDSEDITLAIVIKGMSTKAYRYSRHIFSLPPRVKKERGVVFTYMGEI